MHDDALSEDQYWKRATYSNCFRCNNSGLVFAYKKKARSGVFQFPCFCIRGAKFPGPTWNDIMLKDYVIDDGVRDAYKIANG